MDDRQIGKVRRIGAGLGSLHRESIRGRQGFRDFCSLFPRMTTFLMWPLQNLSTCLQGVRQAGADLLGTPRQDQGLAPLARHETLEEIRLAGRPFHVTRSSGRRSPSVTRASGVMTLFVTRVFDERVGPSLIGAFYPAIWGKRSRRLGSLPQTCGNSIARASLLSGYKSNSDNWLQRTAS